MQNKKRVLVLGATGLIGHQVFNYLDGLDEYELLNFTFRTKLNESSILVDARDEVALTRSIKDNKPDIIINCIGILIGGASKNQENAIFLNAYLPHCLLRIAESINAKLVHISTDCVFSGNKGQYVESDVKDGEGVYPKTKGLGEIIQDKHLTIRTSVIGPELKQDGEELFHWFMSQNGSINGYTESIWSGVSTLELAKAVGWGIKNKISGLYHITNGSSINKYELLSLLKKHTGKDIDIVKVPGRVTNKSFLDTRLEINYRIPSYDAMVKDITQLIKNNRQLYKQYEI
jgi:dTDP-4-dehydrorhamnose reductase